MLNVQLTRILRCRTSRSCNRERQLSFPTTEQRNRRSGDESLGDSMKHLWSPARGLHTDGRRADGHKVENVRTRMHTRARMYDDGDPDMYDYGTTMIGDITFPTRLCFPLEERTYVREKRFVPFPLRRLTAGNCMATQKERVKPARRSRFSRDYPNHYADDVRGCRYRAICFYCRMIIIVAINFNFRIPTR